MNVFNMKRIPTHPSSIPFIDLFLVDQGNYGQLQENDFGPLYSMCIQHSDVKAKALKLPDARWLDTFCLKSDSHSNDASRPHLLEPLYNEILKSTQT